jgi:uncharacterized YccA/Bax inhibitor family protein
MALFKSGNPALSEKTFQEISYTDLSAGAMTINGTLNKLGFMFVLLIAGAVFSWSNFYNTSEYAAAFTYGGGIVGFILALVIIFKKEWSGYVAPAYAICEGLFIGGISAMVNYAFAKTMPNIITNAVGLTLGTAISMFLLYRFQIIKATERFKAVIMTATMGIAVFYLLVWVLRMFGMQVPFMHDSSALGIGISLFVVAIAALNLILDFDMIEKGAEAGAPKYMEWYGAFGLMVTLVWLYMEILRLLSRFSKR